MLKPEDSKNIKLLYVEDDEKAREFTLDIFKRFFDDITIAVNGKDGLEKLKTSYYDLVITDINMPKLSGLDMIKEAREIHKNLYSIVVTAYADHDTFLDSIQLGIKGYIVKPMDIKQLLNVLEEAVHIISAKKEINILKQYKDIVDKTSIVSKANSNGQITFVNDKFCQISGYSRDELIGKQHNIVRDSDTSNEVFHNMWATIKNKDIWTGQIKNRKKDGTAYYVDATICPILDEKNDIKEFIAIRNDISELLNPKKQLLDKIKTSKYPFLIILQINNFTILEHLYNELIIDNLLSTFDKMLYSYLPEGIEDSIIYNLGDGEFAILILSSHESINSTASTLELQLKQLQQNVSKGIIVVNEYDFDISVSISFATKKENLYKNVKYGITEAITNKVGIVFANDLTKEVKNTSLKNSQTIKMIQTAIDNDKIVSHFQAITNNKTMEIEKYESLVRLIDDNDKIISPFFLFRYC